MGRLFGHRRIANTAFVLACVAVGTGCDDAVQNQAGIVTELSDTLVCIENADSDVEFCATIGDVNVPDEVVVGSCVQARSDFTGVDNGNGTRSDPEKLVDLDSAVDCDPN